MEENEELKQKIDGHQGSLRDEEKKRMKERMVAKIACAEIKCAAAAEVLRHTQTAACCPTSFAWKSPSLPLALEGEGCLLAGLTCTEDCSPCTLRYVLTRTIY